MGKYILIPHTHQKEKQGFLARRSLDTPLKLPKPPTLSYFTSRYNGTQKPLYCGILIKTYLHYKHVSITSRLKVVICKKYENKKIC